MISREAFEKHFGPHQLSRNNTPDSDLDGYQDSCTQLAWVAYKLGAMQHVMPMSDAQINEMTYDMLGKWPSFEAQSWACKVVHMVLQEKRRDVP